MGNIPAGADEITWAWMSEVTGWSVDDVAVSQIGVGVGVSSALYRVVLGGDDCPASVVVKLQALAPEAVETSTALGMYTREVLFFEQLAGACPIRVPAHHYTEVDETGGAFVIVMEDLDGNRIVDQVAGMQLADVERAVDRLADWHATWWGTTDGFADTGLAVPLNSPIYPAVIPTLFAEGWAKLSAEVPHVLSGLGAVAEFYGDIVADRLARLGAEPATLLHGDFRADNMMFDADDRFILLDFQLTGTGSGVFDLAYFLTQSLDSDTATANERTLFERWTTRLSAAGVLEVDLDGMWELYRVAALVCLIYPVSACRGMDLTDPRQLALVETMMDRTRRAVDDLDLVELL